MHPGIFFKQVITTIIKKLPLYDNYTNTLLYMSSRMWIIVNFTRENSVEVVPDKWLADNDQCYWPSYKGSKLKSAIADEHEVGEDWDIHPIRIINRNKLYGKIFFVFKYHSKTKLECLPNYNHIISKHASAVDVLSN